mgnify:CR=1 FL=1
MCRTHAATPCAVNVHVVSELAGKRATCHICADMRLHTLIEFQAV